MKQKLTLGFNALLFGYLVFCFAAQVFVHGPSAKHDSPFERLLDKSPVMGSLVGLLIIVIGVWAAVRILEYFWNNFISDVFHLRDISLQEALSIILIVCVLR